MNYTTVSMVAQSAKKKKKIEKFSSRQVAFEDDLNGIGSLQSI